MTNDQKAMAAIAEVSQTVEYRQICNRLRMAIAFKAKVDKAAEAMRRGLLEKYTVRDEEGKRITEPCDVYRAAEYDAGAELYYDEIKERSESYDDKAYPPIMEASKAVSRIEDELLTIGWMNLGHPEPKLIQQREEIIKRLLILGEINE